MINKLYNFIVKLKQFYINGVVYNIQFKDFKKLKLRGKCYDKGSNKYIDVCSERPRVETVSTFIHEYMHAIINETEINKYLTTYLEEKLVESLEVGLINLLREVK